MAYFEALSDDQFNSLIANRLKEDRKAAKVSQEDVANGTGYSKSKVKNIENGRSTIDFPTLRRFCKYYNKTIQYYLPECKETLVEEVDLGDAAESYMSLSHAEQEAIKQFIIALADSRDRK